MGNGLNMRFLTTIALYVLLGTADGSARSLHVDSVNGDDACNGGQSTPVKSLARASEFHFKAGDSLLLRRGASFDGLLRVTGSGRADAPIVITSWGDSSQPAPELTATVLEDANPGNCIRLEGNHIVVTGLSFRDSRVDIAENNSESDFIFMWRLGALYIDEKASYCRVMFNEFTNCGVAVKSYGEHTLIDHNYIHDCSIPLKRWNWGPIGIWLGGDHQEVCYNIVENYRAENAGFIWKNNGDMGADGSAIEIDDGRKSKSDISIHHNYSSDCQGFLEVTYKDVVVAPDYSGFRIYDNVCDDYQQFILLWQGRGCTIENNTVIRRKMNGNEQGVIRIMEKDSGNIIRNNRFYTIDRVRVFWNSALSQPIVTDNIYTPLGTTAKTGDGPAHGGINATFNPAVEENKIGSAVESFGERIKEHFHKGEIWDRYFETEFVL
jgi:hypothetical protein